MKRLGFILLALAGTAHADPRHVSFKDAIDLALAQNPDAALAKEAIAGAEAHTESQKAKRLPTLHVDAVANLYYKPYTLPFGTEVFTLHERVTTAANVTISQPLSGLAYLSEVVGAAEHDTAVKRSEYDKVRLDIAYRTADAYVRVLLARAIADVAKQSVADIQSGLDQAVKLRKADVYTDIDVLRFRSAKAAADQQVWKTQSGSDDALATFVHHLGLPDGSAIEIVDDLPVAPPPLAMALPAAQARALAARPELRAAREKLAAANATRDSVHWLYFPDIRAVGVYEHTTGVQPFAPANEEFIGLRLSWNVWDWGNVKQQVNEAEHAQARAKLDASSLGEQVKLEVRHRWSDARTAFDSLDAAKTQQETAQEAYRLQKVRFDAAAATATDVLDAQIDVARARLAFAVARYDYYLALVGLARSVGDVPQA